MAMKEDRADRIRALFVERDDLSWPRIAAFVGVVDRSAQEWQKSGGIEYKHAERLAQLFDVNVDWLWAGRGPRDVRAPAPPEQVQRIEDKLDEVLRAVRLAVDAALDAEDWAGFGALVHERADDLRPTSQPNESQPSQNDQPESGAA